MEPGGVFPGTQALSYEDRLIARTIYYCRRQDTANSPVYYNIDDSAKLLLDHLRVGIFFHQWHRHHLPVILHMTPTLALMTTIVRCMTAIHPLMTAIARRPPASFPSMTAMGRCLTVMGCRFTAMDLRLAALARFFL